MQTFTTRSLSNPLVEWVKPPLKRFALRIARYLWIWACVHIALLFLIKSVSALTFNPQYPPLSFTPALPERQILLPAFPVKQVEGYWHAPQEPAYKNERIMAYQDMLKERGITDPEHLRLFVAQLLQENGAISENVDGDGGCSIGIPQRNTCNFRDPVTGRWFNAKTFRQRYPAWNDWRTQMEWMADYTAANYKKFPKVRCVIVNHNRPASARPCTDRTDTKARYYGKIAARSQALSLL
jgi:hypothetical protein